MLIVKTKTPVQESATVLLIRGGHEVIIDKDRLTFLSKFKWFLLKSSSTFYVCTRKIKNGKCYTVRMHRLLMQTPAGIKCHHVNHNSLDNRLENLSNITEREHRHFDGWHIFER